MTVEWELPVGMEPQLARLKSRLLLALNNHLKRRAV